MIFAALTLASLIVTWLVTSRLGEHNDLGWRAVLPRDFRVDGVRRGWTCALDRAGGLRGGRRCASGSPACASRWNPVDHRQCYGPFGAFSTRVRASAGTVGSRARAHRARRAHCQQPATISPTSHPGPSIFPGRCWRTAGPALRVASSPSLTCRCPMPTASRSTRKFIRIFAGQGSAGDVRDLRPRPLGHCRVVCRWTLIRMAHRSK